MLLRNHRTRVNDNGYRTPIQQPGTNLHAQTIVLYFKTCIPSLHWQGCQICCNLFPLGAPGNKIQKRKIKHWAWDHMSPLLVRSVTHTWHTGTEVFPIASHTLALFRGGTSGNRMIRKRTTPQIQPGL